MRSCLIGVARRIGRPIRHVAVPFGLCALLLTVPLPRAGAQETPKTITVGESNAPDQVAELLAYFGARAGDPVVTVTLADTHRAMEGIFDTSDIASAYSSTALTCRAPGAGLEVTTRNITVVTPGLYAMALATAGIDDAILAVAAPDDAPAEGLTALTGVFATWEAGQCPSAATDVARQRLALEELALTADIGSALGAPDGARAAADLVLDVQREIVVRRLTDRSAIDAAVAQEVAAIGADLPAIQWDRLVDLMSRLAGAEIDWGTFAAGWKVKQSPDASSVAMSGVGVSVGGPASAAPDPTATVDVRAASEAAALTATATAPTPTPIPSPTPTADPFTVRGSVVDARGDQLSVAPEGGSGAPLAYAIEAGATVERAGKPATADQIAKNDTVTMTVDGRTGRVVTAIAAEPKPAGPGSRLAGLWPLLLAGLLVPVVAGAALRRKRVVLAQFVRSSRPAAVPAAVRRRAHSATAFHRRVWLRPQNRADRSDEAPS